MEDKITLIMDLFAGILIGIQFLLKRQTHARIDQAILKRLKRRIAPRGLLRNSMIILAVVLTAAILLFFIVRGLFVDLAGGVFTPCQIAISTVILIVGLAVGIGVFVLIIWLHKKVNWLRRQDPIKIVVLTTMLLGIVFVSIFISLVGRVSIYVTSFLVTFSIGIMLMGIWIGMMPYAQKYLTFKSGILIRFGILLFIASRIIQLVS